MLDIYNFWLDGPHLYPLSIVRATIAQELSQKLWGFLKRIN